MNHWIYEDSIVSCHSDLPKSITHIVYMLTFTDGVKYVGYKTVRSERRLVPTKAQLAIILTIYFLDYIKDK